MSRARLAVALLVFLTPVAPAAAQYSIGSDPVGPENYDLVVSSGSSKVRLDGRCVSTQTSGPAEGLVYCLTVRPDPPTPQLPVAGAPIEIKAPAAMGSLLAFADGSPTRADHVAPASTGLVPGLEVTSPTRLGLRAAFQLGYERRYAVDLVALATVTARRAARGRTIATVRSRVTGTVAIGRTCVSAQLAKRRRQVAARAVVGVGLARTAGKPRPQRVCVVVRADDRVRSQRFDVVVRAARKA